MNKGVNLEQKFSTKRGGFTLKNPVIAASGTYGYSIECEIFNDVSTLGAIVTKAITLEPRAGNEGVRLYETASGMINRIGLENVGVEEFVAKKIPVLEKSCVNYIVNVAGSAIEDYCAVAKTLNEALIGAIELNVSCPNVKSGCLEFGTDPAALGELVSAVRGVFDGLLIVKLTPNVSDIESLALATQKAGADCISAINTLKGLGVNLNFMDGKFHKTFVQGGLSGRAIKPVALSFVKRIRETVNLPLIGLGGIANLQDMLEFMAVGADAVQIGTENFTHPDICGRLVNELEEFMAASGFKTIQELKEALK